MKITFLIHMLWGVQKIRNALMRGGGHLECYTNVKLTHNYHRKSVTWGGGGKLQEKAIRIF